MSKCSLFRLLCQYLLSVSSAGLQQGPVSPEAAGLGRHPAGKPGAGTGQGGAARVARLTGQSASVPILLHSVTWVTSEWRSPGPENPVGLLRTGLCGRHSFPGSPGLEPSPRRQPCGESRFSARGEGGQSPVCSMAPVRRRGPAGKWRAWRAPAPLADQDQKQTQKRKDAFPAECGAVAKTCPGQGPRKTRMATRLGRRDGRRRPLPGCSVRVCVLSCVRPGPQGTCSYTETVLTAQQDGGAPGTRFGPARRQGQRS